MTIGDIFAGPVSFEALQQSKALQPLSDGASDQLQKLVRLDITGFNETEVRAYIIDPLVALLGYEKGTDFSVDLGKSIQFLDKKKFPDYKFNLWKEDFWLIEAKTPKPRESAFGYNDLAQALEYACHPDINAALVVLCDGEKIEVFDREVSIVTPVLRSLRADWIRDIDKIRLLLEPWQTWFFQKRRVIRLLDRVFDKEFNLDRIAEFTGLVEGRLDSKRLVVLKNFQSTSRDDRAEVKHLKDAPLHELVEVHLFLNQSNEAVNALFANLLERSMQYSFPVLYKIFPDHPRSANDHFFAKALCYLTLLGERQQTVGWMPAWLSPGKQSQVEVDEAVKRLLRLCLTNFEGDEARRAIILASAALRRVFKILLLSSEQVWHTAEALHFLNRYTTPELSWSQFGASSEGHVLAMLNTNAMGALNQFVHSCRSDRGDINVEVAKVKLRSIWKFEAGLLAANPDYTALLRERSLGEMYPTEAATVTHDYLGHVALCLLRVPRWRAYAIETHKADLECLAALGSFSAKEMLGFGPLQEFLPVEDEVLSKRFFFGDVASLTAIRSGYR